MLKAQISSWISQAIRFKLHPDQVTLIMDAAQRMAFDHNTPAFLVWKKTLTPLAATLTYSAPIDPPCRKIWGVTTETDARIFGTDNSLTFPMNDFDFLPRLLNPAAFFKPGREDNIAKTFTFAQQPDTTGLLAYRWVYWRDAPTIATTDAADDETKIQIPAAYHMNFINACIKLAQLNLSGEDVDPKVIQAFFQPWWNTLARPYTPMGKKTNQTLNPRGSADSLI